MTPPAPDSLPPTVSEFSPMPALDIVSTGYRQLFKLIRPILTMALPFVVINAVLGGLSQEQYLQIQAQQEFSPYSQMDFAKLLPVYGIMVIAALVMAGCLWYFHYMLICYAVDVYQHKQPKELTHYLRPDARLVGWFGYNLIVAVANMVMMIGVILGLILLILPGLAAIAGMVYVNIRFCMAYIAYFMNPKAGLIQAFQQSWDIVHQNFWRTLGVFAVCAIVAGMVKMPFDMIEFITNLVVGFTLRENLAKHNPIVFLVYVINMGLAFSVQSAALAGGTFIAVRYYYDLLVRKSQRDNPTQEPTIPAEPFENWDNG